jgi:hypothetical protein
MLGGQDRRWKAQQGTGWDILPASPNHLDILAVLVQYRDQVVRQAF